MGEVTGGCGLSTSGRWSGARGWGGCWVGVPLSPHALDEFHLDLAPKGICQKQLPICTLIVDFHFALSNYTSLNLLCANL